MATTVPFINNLSSGVNPSAARGYHSHDTEKEQVHMHGPGPGEHGHTHEHLDHPGAPLHISVIH